MFTFPYAQYEDELGDSLWMPHISITLERDGNEVDVFPALLDTGATHTVLPMSFASDLGFTIDRDEFISVRTANGLGRIYPSSAAVTCILIDPETGERTQWESSTVFFSDEAGTALIGHKGCMEKFDMLFKGEEKVVEMEALF